MTDSGAPLPVAELLAQREWVRALAARLVRPDHADDVEQTAWLAAIERPPHRVASPRGWFTAVLRNAARKAMRAADRRSRHEQATPPRPGAATTADLVAAAELQQLVARAVLDLDEPYRGAILLRFYEGLTPAEIGERLGVPPETVRTRLRRAIEQLRGRLDRERSGDRAAWLVPMLAWEAAGDGPPAAAGVSSPATTWWSKGAAMGISKKLAIGTCLVLLVAAAVTVIRMAGSGTSATDSGNSSAGTPPTRVPPRKPAPRAAALPPAEVAADVVPEPVDLSRCDRDLDLHGVVVRTDGTPVAGAHVAAIAYPWRRVYVLHGHDVDAEGPRSRTATDGSFALRLNRGDNVSLRVTASGFVDAERPDCQAGERMRIVLSAGVELRIECVDEAGAPRPDVGFRVFNPAAFDTFVVRRSARTDAAGVAVVPDLPPGIGVQIALATDGLGEPGWTPVKLPDSGAVTRRIVVPAGRTVRGRVFDAETGTPVPSARVGMGWTLDHAVATGADGAYSFPGWTDRYGPELEAAAEGYETGVVAVGTSDVADFALRRGFGATGRIVGADGATVGGAQVSLLAALPRADSDPMQRVSHAHATTSADGRFTVAGLRRELTHTLVVTAPGHARVLRDVQAPSMIDTPGGESRPGTAELGDVALAASRSIEGVVVDGRGDGVPRVQVTLAGPDAAAPSPFTTHYGAAEARRSDDLGRFRFPDLAPGRYTISAHTAGRPPVQVTWELPADADLAGGTIVVGGGRTLVVRVVDEAGAPLAGAQVQCDEGGAMMSKRTGPDGAVTFEGLARQVSLVVYGVAGKLPASWTPVPSGATTFDIVLHASGQLFARLEDGSGRPLAQANVRASFGGRVQWWTVTDADGNLRAHIPASGVTLDFDGIADGAETGWTMHRDDVRPGTGVVLRCVPTPTDRTLRVRVETPAGEPVAGVPVLLTQMHWMRPARAKTGSDGVALLADLPARPLRLSCDATAEFARPAATDVTPAGQEVVLRMRPSVPLRGRLVRAGGEGVRGMVSCRTQAALNVSSDEIDARPTADDGTFTLSVPDDATAVYTIAGFTEDGKLVGQVYEARMDDPATRDLRIVLKPPAPR